MPSVFDEADEEIARTRSQFEEMTLRAERERQPHVAPTGPRHAQCRRLGLFQAHNLPLRPVGDFAGLGAQVKQPLLIVPGGGVDLGVGCPEGFAEGPVSETARDHELQVV